MIYEMLVKQLCGKNSSLRLLRHIPNLGAAGSNPAEDTNKIKWLAGRICKTMPDFYNRGANFLQ
jgi:hypothetical protein